MDMRSYVSGIFTGIGIGIILYVLFVRRDFFPLPWLRARFSGAPVSMMQIMGMRLRGHPSNLLIDAYIALIQAGEKISIDEVESAYMANIYQVTDIDTDTLVQLVREHERESDSAKE